MRLGLTSVRPPRRGVLEFVAVVGLAADVVAAHDVNAEGLYNGISGGTNFKL